MLPIKYSVSFFNELRISNMSASNDFGSFLSICSPEELESAGTGGSGNMVGYPYKPL